MKRFAAFAAACLLAFLIVSCDDNSPLSLTETITFEVTAQDNDAVRYDPICDPSLGVGGTYPVSIEFKPEIRIYPPNSSSYEVVALPSNGAVDPEYFGVTPCKDIDTDIIPPCIPCCEDSLSSCTDCLDQDQNPLNGNYRFTVTASAGKVVGIFRKKNYQQEVPDDRDNAELIVRVCLNGQIADTYTSVTRDEGGGVYVTIPIK